MERFSAISNWQEIIDVQERRWEVIRAYPGRLDLNYSGNMREYIWSKEMQYLLEAYLRLEKNREADELVRI